MNKPEIRFYNGVQTFNIKTIKTLKSPTVSARTGAILRNVKRKMDIMDEIF